MDRPSKTFSKAGFYLVLLFSFCVSIFPKVAFLIAGAAFALWVLEQVIFKNTDWIDEPMFYPVAGFMVFTFISFIVSKYNSSFSSIMYTGYLAVFYFVVQRFVSLSEKRKMIVWTFISGVVLSIGIKIVLMIANRGDSYLSEYWASEQLSFFVILVFVIVLSFYSESEKIGEKFFFGMVSLPIIAFAFLTFSTPILLIIIILMLLVGVFKDRSVLVPLAVAFLFYMTGNFDLIENVTAGNIIHFVKSPLTEISRGGVLIGNTAFFGVRPDVGNIEIYSFSTKSYFFKLLLNSGPAALILLFWVMAEQSRRCFSKLRKVALSEMKIYYLSSVLTLIAVVILNIFGSSFGASASVLVFWMMLGMSEI